MGCQKSTRFKSKEEKSDINKEMRGRKRLPFSGIIVHIVYDLKMIFIFKSPSFVPVT